MSTPASCRVAVICTVYNEALLLPLWLTYYGTEFGLGNLYVIDDGSTDGSTDNLGAVNVIKIDHKEIDQDRRAFEVSCFHEELLKHYDAAIYVDIDEFLVPDPLLRSPLKHYIATSPLTHFTALGLNVLQNPIREAAYTREQAVFLQRQFVQFERFYCKPLIHKQPARWSAGFHWSNKPLSLARGLYLFHTRAFDTEISRVRIIARNKLAWSAEAIERNQGWQNRLSARAYLEKFYIYDQKRFDAAVPANRFNEYIGAMAELVQDNPAAHPAAFGDVEALVLRIPDRFAKCLGPVVPLEQIAEENLHAGLDGVSFDVSAAYSKAVAAAAREREFSALHGG